MAVSRATYYTKTERGAYFQFRSSFVFWYEKILYNVFWEERTEVAMVVEASERILYLTGIRFLFFFWLPSVP